MCSHRQRHKTKMAPKKTDTDDSSVDSQPVLSPVLEEALKLRHFDGGTILYQSNNGCCAGSLCEMRHTLTTANFRCYGCAFYAHDDCLRGLTKEDQDIIDKNVRETPQKMVGYCMRCLTDGRVPIPKLGEDIESIWAIGPVVLKDNEHRPFDTIELLSPKEYEKKMEEELMGSGGMKRAKDKDYNPGNRDGFDTASDGGDPSVKDGSTTSYETSHDDFQPQDDESDDDDFFDLLDDDDDDDDDGADKVVAKKGKKKR